MSFADPISTEISLVQGEDSVRIDVLGSSDDGGMRHVHWVIRVLLHQFEASTERLPIHKPNLQCTSENEISQGSALRPQGV